MPQVFQVLRCYKCSVFQVHQTKKDKKWICKMCGEKQSIKRHHGIGTAKDCRLHVQKLNNLLGVKDESKQKYVDSEDSDFEENITNNQTITKDSVNNIEKDSKWSIYVEKEEVKESKSCVSDVHLPKNVKVIKNSNVFKAPKLSVKCDESTEIIHSENLTNFSSGFDCISRINNISNNLEKCKNVTTEYPKIKTNRDSKWNEFVESDDDIENKHSVVEKNNKYRTEKNTEHHNYYENVGYDYDLLKQVNESASYDNSEVHYNKPKKRKVNKNSENFKAPKVKCDERTNSEKETILSDLDFNSGINKNFNSIEKFKSEHPKFKIDKGSKWAAFVETDDDMENVHSLVENQREKNTEHYNYFEEDEDAAYDYNHEVDGVNRNHSNVIKNDNSLISIENRHLFSLSDDSDLDNILDF